MNKSFIPAEKNLKKLLKDLSADKRPYPKDLLQARRAAYLSQVVSVVGNGPHLTKGGRPGQSGSSSSTSPMTPLMKVVLTVLVATNAALASYLAISVYENWNKVRELLFVVPTVVETHPAPLEMPTDEIATTLPSEFTPSPEGIIVSSATPEPASPPVDPQPSDATVPDSPQVGPSEPEVSTPEPDGNDNPGKHLGQTPHGPGDPPGQDNQDSDQDNDEGDDKDKDKDEKDKDNNP